MPEPLPVKLQLKRDEKLTIHWNDGAVTHLSVRALRKHCPCATCKELRTQMKTNRLTVLPTAGEGGSLAVADAKLVGNYALNVTWADGHAAGIYSFSYLRELSERSV